MLVRLKHCAFPLSGFRHIGIVKYEDEEGFFTKKTTYSYEVEIKLEHSTITIQCGSVSECDKYYDECADRIMEAYYKQRGIE